jgi:hypothetical protein
MSQTLAVWLLIALSLASANLPFLTERVFAVFAWKKGEVAKPIWIRLVELLLYYVVVVFLGFAFEAALGNLFVQQWEFYAITFSLYIVLAYPGYVFRYLFKRRA